MQYLMIFAEHVSTYCKMWRGKSGNGSNLQICRVSVSNLLLSFSNYCSIFFFSFFDLSSYSEPLLLFFRFSFVFQMLHSLKMLNVKRFYFYFQDLREPKLHGRILRFFILPWVILSFLKIILTKQRHYNNIFLTPELDLCEIGPKTHNNKVYFEISSAE